MKFKPILLLVIFLCLMSSAIAVPTDSLVAFYTLNLSGIDATGKWDVTAINAPTFNVTAKIADGVALDGVNQGLSTDGTDPSLVTNAFTFNGWYNHTGPFDTSFELLYRWADGSNAGLDAYFEASLGTADKFRAEVEITGGTQKKCEFTEDGFDDGEFHMYTMTVDTTRLIAYIDAEQKCNVTTGADLDTHTAQELNLGFKYDESEAWTGEMDAIGLWNESLNYDNVTQLYASNMGFPYPFIPLPSTDNFSITAQDKITFTTILDINATVNGVFYDANSTGHINTNFTLNASRLYNLTIEGKDYDTNYYFNVNGSSNFLGNLSFYYYSAAQFKAVAFENANTRINLTINISGDQVTDTNAEIIYNGTVYVPTEVNNVNQTIWTALVDTPTLLSGPTNVTFFWNYTIDRGANVTSVLSEHTQDIIAIGIDNCTVFTIPTLNFTLRNETDLSEVNGSVEGYFEVFVSSESNFVPFNLSWNTPRTRFPICVNNESADYRTNAQLEYGATGFTTKTYYLSNASLTSSFSNIDLFLTDGTTQVTFTVTDENDDPVANALIKVLSYDLPTNTFKTTEILKTDSDGQAVGSIIQNTQFYKFLIELNNVLLLETEPTIITSNTKEFRIQLVSDYLTSFNSALGVSCAIDFTNDTRNFNYIFDDPTGNALEGCLSVTKRSINGDVIFNETCVESSAGNILVNIGTADNDFTWIGNGFVTIDSNKFVCGTPAFQDDDLGWKFYGEEGVWTSVMMIFTLTAIGLFNPVAGIIFGLFGLIIVNIIGLFHLSAPILWGFILIAGIAMFKARAK